MSEDEKNLQDDNRMSKQAAIPDLVFVDLCLPIIDGYGIIRRLKAKPAFAQTVFVILSRRDGVLDRLKGRLAGASIYLTKPCKTQEIVAVVQTYLVLLLCRCGVLPA